MVNQFHWLAPATMVGSLGTGAALIVGHHLFYSYLDGKDISSGVSLSYVSTQQANIAIGTAFAFLVRASLVLAVSIAFVQVFWRSFAPKDECKPYRLKQLDSAFAVLGNITSMLNLPMWWRYPSIFLVASIAWTVPIASIVTPATMSIKSAAVYPFPVSMRYVPNLDFRSTAFLETMPNKATDDYRSGTGKFEGWTQRLFAYNGSSAAVAAAIKPIMANGELPLFTSPALNASWDVQFYGPVLQCSNMSQDDNIQLRKEWDLYTSCPRQLYTYLAWYGNTSGSHAPLPLQHTTNGSQESKDWYPAISYGGNCPHTYYRPFYAGSLAPPRQPQKPMDMYVATLQRHLQDGSNSIYGPGRELTYLRCELRNGTYDVAMSQIDGVQEVTIKAVLDDSLPPPLTVPEVATDWLHNNWYEFDRGLQYCSAQASDCIRNPSLLPRLAYQSIMDTFSSYLVGSIEMTTFGVAAALVDTQVLETVISTSNEVFDTYRPIFRWADSFGDGNSFQSYLSETLNLSQSEEWLGVVPKIPQGRRSGIPLATMLEKLFQNITVGLMGSPNLQPNLTSSSAPPKVNVTFHPWHNVYTYAPIKLGAAYGAAILSTAIVVAFGLFSMISNGACYSNDFSTIFRMSRGAHISTAIEPEALSGKDPLPKYLAEANVRFQIRDLDREMRHGSEEGRGVPGAFLKYGSGSTLRLVRSDIT